MYLKIVIIINNCLSCCVAQLNAFLSFSTTKILLYIVAIKLFTKIQTKDIIFEKLQYITVTIKVHKRLFVMHIIEALQIVYIQCHLYLLWTRHKLFHRLTYQMMEKSNYKSKEKLVLKSYRSPLLSLVGSYCCNRKFLMRTFIQLYNSTWRFYCVGVS